MKKIFMLTCLALLLVSSLSLVSAKTLIAGKIYNADYSEVIEDADVTVTCNGHEQTYPGGSESDGSYAVSFSTDECDAEDIVYVTAVKGELSGSESGTVYDEDHFDICMNLAVVNVPLVPEFGLFIGALTIVSAVGIFFFVRKK